MNPSDGSTLATFSGASTQDVDDSAAAALGAFGQWRDTAPQTRTRLLLRAASLVEERCDQLARLATLEIGQPHDQAVEGALRAAEIIAWDANEARRLYGRVIPAEPNIASLVVREPVGPVAAFTPWNAPIFTPCRKIGSALGAGCTLVMKCAEEAPGTASALVRCFLDAGIPNGVLNVVFGDPGIISQRLINSGAIRLVSFTGSAAVGRLLAEQAGSQMKPTIMELGGHAPVIVCADADLGRAVAALVAAKYRNAGQACLAPTRIWAHSAVYDRFVDAFVAAASVLQPGDPRDTGTIVGPLASERRVHAVEGLVEDARSKGATVRLGGTRLGSPGWHFEPTVLTCVPAHAAIMSEEPFGPVAIINVFDDLDAVIDAANSLPYGLAAYVFTDSAAIAHRTARRLECGAIGINHTRVSTSGIPFGGVKGSGFGREGAVEGISSYTFAKTITQAY